VRVFKTVPNPDKKSESSTPQLRFSSGTIQENPRDSGNFTNRHKTRTILAPIGRFGQVRNHCRPPMIKTLPPSGLLPLGRQLGDRLAE
jgi:hypothetical protein